MTKFARTMNEAFPHGADYGCAIKIAYRRPLFERLFVSAIYAIFSVASFAAVLCLMLAYFDVLVP